MELTLSCEDDCKLNGVCWEERIEELAAEWLLGHHYRLKLFQFFLAVVSFRIAR